MLFISDYYFLYLVFPSSIFLKDLFVCLLLINFCVGVCVSLSVCACVDTHVFGVQRPEEGTRSFRAGITDVCQMPGCYMRAEI